MLVPLLNIEILQMISSFARRTLGTFLQKKKREIRFLEIKLHNN